MEYKKIIKDGETYVLTPIVLQFKSDLIDGKYYRLGDKSKELNDAIYRKSTYNDFAELTEQEKEELIKQNHLLSKYHSYGKDEFIEKLLNYCEI